MLITIAARLVIQAAGKQKNRGAMDTWDRFEFLIGSWSSPVSAQPGEGVSGSTNFSFDLDKNVMIRTSRAEFAPEAGAEQGLVHQDLLVVYRQPTESQFRAIYFDNEGHVIHYAVSFPAKQPAVVFTSEATDTSPPAQLVYELLPDGSLSIEFFVAPPGGKLESHVKGIVRRTEAR